MGKMILLGVAMMLAGKADAGPYFRAKPLSKIEAGAFLKLGTPQGENVRLGLVSPFIWHDSRDGYWLIPGVDWQLLNVGVTTDTEFRRGSLILGPGITLDEPIKGILRKVLEFLPGRKNEGAYGLLTTILAPGSPGNDAGYLSVGPMWGVSPSPGYEVWDVQKLRGSLQLGISGATRFGGEK